MPPEISIIIPMYNEAGNVGPLAAEVLAALRDERRPFEVVLVDDASTDETWRQIQSAHAADPRVRGVRHVKNAGQSAAVWTGFRATTSPILGTLDGDMQNDPADLPRMLAELERFDLVCGMRVTRKDNFVRRVSSRVARWARKSALGADFRDTGCGLRVFKRPVLEGLPPFNGFHRFMPILVQGGGGRVSEVPVNHRPRGAGMSKYGMWNRLGRGIFDLIGVAWFQKRRLRPTATEEFPPVKKGD